MKTHRFQYCYRSPREPRRRRTVGETRSQGVSEPTAPPTRGGRRTSQQPARFPGPAAARCDRQLGSNPGGLSPCPQESLIFHACKDPAAGRTTAASRVSGRRPPRCRNLTASAPQRPDRPGVARVPRDNGPRRELHERGDHRSSVHPIALAPDVATGNASSPCDEATVEGRAPVERPEFALAKHVNVETSSVSLTTRCRTTFCADDRGRLRVERPVRTRASIRGRSSSITRSSSGWTAGVATHNPTTHRTGNPGSTPTPPPRCSSKTRRPQNHFESSTRELTPSTAPRGRHRCPLLASLVVTRGARSSLSFTSYPVATVASGDRASHGPRQ